MNIMFIEISSASMFGSRQVFSGEIFVRLDSSAAFFSRWTGFRSPALTSCSFYFGRYRISVPEMVFFIFLWVGPNPPSGIGSLWVLVVLVPSGGDDGTFPRKDDDHVDHDGPDDEDEDKNGD